MAQTQPIGVHLVGSAPVETSEQIFRLASEHLGSHLKRLGDGEVGERDTWIRFQADRLRQSPQLREQAESLPDRPVKPLELVDTGLTPEDIELPDLGYAKAAIASHQKFVELQSEGVIPGHVRFMVGLPTPLGVVTTFVDEAARATVVPAYQVAIMAELRRIFDNLPHEELSIQWESVYELMMLEGHPGWTYFGDDHELAIRAHFAEITNVVPEPVELGVHLCYGDRNHQHFMEPTDTGIMVRVANWIAAECGRTLNFLHMPVPRERHDDAYFEPLKNLNISDETELYLGLVHNTGGIEGTKRRIETAQKYYPNFGVATECGLARRPLESIPDLLRQHADVADVRNTGYDRSM